MSLSTCLLPKNACHCWKLSFLWYSSVYVFVNIFDNSVVLAGVILGSCHATCFPIQFLSSLEKLEFLVRSWCLDIPLFILPSEPAKHSIFGIFGAKFMVEKGPLFGAFVVLLLLSLLLLLLSKEWKRAAKNGILSTDRISNTHRQLSFEWTHPSLCWVFYSLRSVFCLV